MEVKYPVDDEIKVEWTLVHKGLIAFSLIIPILFLLLHACTWLTEFPRLAAVLGLSASVAGTTIATLRPPFYGAFIDGGELQRKSEKVTSEYFRTGMSIAALGFSLQALGILLE